ncbi:ribonuclease H-like domain-containing protein [Tanacetum coccineum]
MPAFLSAEDTNSINEVNTANGVSTASGHNSQGQASSSTYTNDLMFLFFANQSNSPQLDDEDLEHIDHDDLEEMDLKWQVVMLFMRVKRFYKKIGKKLIFNGKEPIGFDKTKVECFNCHGRGYFAKECRASRNHWNRNGDTGKNEAVYEEKIAVLEFEVKDKDKTGLGYGDQLNESHSKVINSVFDSRSCDGDDNQTNDRFKKGNEYHVVPPPLTGNYMPPLADLSFTRLDDFVYRPTANKTSASVSHVETSITLPSNTSAEMPRVESVRPSGVIIEEWVSDDDEDIFQSNEDPQTIVKPSFKKIEFNKARNEPVKSD